MTAIILRSQYKPKSGKTIKPKKDLQPIELRDSQKLVKAELYNRIRDGYNRIQLVAPCGFGKTILSASLVYDMTVRRDKKVLFLVHAKCLVEQTIEAFARYGLWAGAIAGGLQETRSKPIQVAMLQTLARGRDISWFKPDFVIADECHETLWSNWSLKQFPRLLSGEEVHNIFALDAELRAIGIDTVFHDAVPTYEQAKAAFKEAAFKNHPDQGGSKEAMQRINAAWQTIRDHRDLFEGNRPTSSPKLIGLTATPWRLSKRQSMGDIFPVQVIGPTPGEQVQLGIDTGFTQGLVPFVYWRVPGAEFKSVKVGAGRDFTEAELAEIGKSFSMPEIIQCAVDNYLSKAKGRSFACFPTSIRHAQLLHHAFNKAGIKCALVTGETSNKHRQIIYQEIRGNLLAGIISVGCIGIGFDLPEISCIVDCCPTMSKAKFVQAAGRGQRIAPWINKKDCIYLDQAGNVSRHGMIEDIKYGELIPAEETPVGEAPVKECPECGHINLSFATKCAECGYEFPVPKKEMAVGDMVLMIREGEEDLFEAFQEQVRQCYLVNEAPTNAVYRVNELYKKHPSVMKAKIKGTKDGKFGTWYPRKEWYYHAVFENPCLEDTQAYMKYLQACSAKYSQPKPAWWFENYMKREFGENWKSLPSNPNYKHNTLDLPEDF